VLSSYTQGEEEKNLVYVLLGRISRTEVFSNYTQGEEEKNLVYVLLGRISPTEVLKLGSFPLLPGFTCQLTLII
jgi:hypothetical protein